MTLMQARWGAGVGKSCLIYVTVGTGIGGGIILNGELYGSMENGRKLIAGIFDPCAFSSFQCSDSRCIPHI
jgi:glucokinase